MIRFKKDDGSNYPDWEEKNIVDMAKKQKGAIKIGPFGSALKKECYVDNGIKVYAQENIFEEDFSIGSYYITEEKYKTLESCTLKPNDLVISMMGTIGSCAIFPDNAEKGIMNSHLLRIQFDKDINVRYVKILLKESPIIRRQIDKLSVGGIMSGLSSSVVQKLNFPVPCFEEQQKIADFLSSVDEVISASEKEVVNLEEQKKGVMQKIFSQEVRFKADDGSDYPEWEEKRVEDLFKITRGYVLSKDKLIEKADEKILYPVYSSQTLNDGLMGYYDKFLYENAITWTTDGANAGTVKYREGKFYCTNVCGVLISEKYANKCIANILGLESYKHVSQKGANPKLMNNVMGKIKITIPVSIEEQQKITDLLSDFDRVIDLAKQELEQWKELKKGLLQQLFE